MSIGVRWTLCSCGVSSENAPNGVVAVCVAEVGVQAAASLASASRTETKERRPSLNWCLEGREHTSGSTLCTPGRWSAENEKL